MPVKQLNPYLNFNGNAAKAIQLYESALGAKTETIQRFGDIPSMPTAPENKDRVMHALLRIDSGLIMISDSMPDQPVSAGDTTHIVLDFDDPKEMARKFEALSAGGKVKMPLNDTFWGATFGMLVDAYGIHWMFNYTKPR